MSIFSSGNAKERLRAFVGNYVLIGSGKLFVLLAHLQQNSIQVGEGEEISEGTQIGLIGNSGNTVAPHLHFQMMDDEDPFRAQIMAFKIRNYERWTGTEWKTMTLHIPEKGECIRTTRR